VVCASARQGSCRKSTAARPSCLVFFSVASSVALALRAGAAEQVRALIECQRLQPLALPEEGAEGPMSLRQAAAGGLLSAEVALMWCVVCTWLQVRLLS
jgi:hypothetical protein